MKPKFILLLFVLMFISKRSFADFPLACGSYDSCATAITCSTSTGIYLSPYSSGQSSTVSVVHITGQDSMIIHLSLSGCYISQISDVTVNNVAVGYVASHLPSSWVIRMLSVPGDYFISCWNSSALPVSARFTQVLDPVGIKEAEEITKKSVSVFPNPATNELTVLSKSSALKSIRIFNSSGEEKEIFNVTSNELKIPLTNYPPGIYFIHVATLNDKTTIKKVIVK